MFLIFGPLVHQVGMTPEQQERMRKNKLVAMQKRAARLGVSVESLSKCDGYLSKS